MSGTSEKEAGNPSGEGPAEATNPQPVAPMTRASVMRGVGVAFVGVLLLGLQLACSRQLPHGALFGLASTALVVGGVLQALGLLRTAPGDASASSWFAPLPGEPTFFAPRVTLPLAFLIAAIALVGLMVGGHGRGVLSDGTVAVLFLASCAVLGLSALRRPALVPIVILSAIYLPRLGAFALWDPWETHYGEVAREILSRDDWVSLWWAQENWFWSKPILIFWTEAWTMSALGVSAIPDAHPAHPEWALRLPIFVMSMMAVVAVQAFTSRAFGKRAGTLAALVVGSMPHFYLLAHQAITDMPLAASLTVALCLLGLALLDDGVAEPARYRIGPFGVSGRTLAVGVLLLLAVPQIVYLATRNLTFFPGEGFSVHQDVFLEGSAGNEGVPGNVEVHTMAAVHPNPQPAVQALIWLVALVLTVALVQKARTRRAAYLYGFYIACAVGFLGKGIPGFALPGLVALFHLVATRRWSLLRTGELRIPAGIAIIATLGLPWYVAMSIRHGRGFLDRILIHDHINRLASGVHGDTGPIDYFLAQLGYATFPWIGLVPIAVLAFVWLPKASPEEGDTRREAATFVALWAMAGFTLFNAMITKFHHYIFPVVPPAGLLVGVVLDRILGPSDERPLMRRLPAMVAIAVGTLLCLVAVAGATGSARGIIPEGATGQDWILQHAWPLSLTLPLGLTGLLLLGLAVFADRGLPRATELSALERGLAASALGGAMLVAFVGRDTSWVTATRPNGYERFIDLFVYLYTRPWPAYLDYRPAFTAFAVVGTAATIGLAFTRLRRTSAGVLLAAALALATFSVDMYLPDLAEHWSSHRLVDRYYARRRDSLEPILAFQMNWKGENFYTGNRVHVFQDLDTAPVRRWMEANRGKTFFLLVEHGRLENFRALMPTGSTLEPVTTARDNNKSVLAHARIAPPPGS